MKHILLTIIIAFSSIGLSAQEVVRSFLDKHAADESIELTTIGRKMFAAMQEQSLVDDYLLSIISGLESINIVTSTDQSLVSEYIISAKKIVEKNNKYTPVYESDGDQCVLLTIRQSDESIRELVVLTGDTTTFSLISFLGNIEVENLVNYAKLLNLNSLEDIINDKNSVN